MNWTRVLLATVVGAVAMWLVSFVLHGMLLAETYIGLPEVFSQEAANPMLFLFAELLIALPAVIIFAKTRSCWAPGIGGGLSYGFLLGLIGGFSQHFNPLIFEGFPYSLAWYWFAANVVITMSLGAVVGLMIKR
ncbi:MAG: hypothetical protein HKN12_04545 [Gemmatimonadetes bacterium]|nr:hypothetical protein [Gemmatimonadota bacterium]